MQLVWMARALRDLDWICGYIGRCNPRTASHISREIKSSALRLKQFPLMGRESEEKGIRLLQVTGRPYVLAYRCTGSQVTILSVFDQRRNPEDIV